MNQQDNIKLYWYEIFIYTFSGLYFLYTNFISTFIFYYINYIFYSILYLFIIACIIFIIIPNKLKSITTSFRFNLAFFVLNFFLMIWVIPEGVHHILLKNTICFDAKLTSKFYNRYGGNGDIKFNIDIFKIGNLKEKISFSEINNIPSDKYSKFLLSIQISQFVG